MWWSSSKRVRAYKTTTVVALALATGCVTYSAESAESRAPVVAAASDLQFALVAVAAQFERETGKKLRLTFGSSGNFARQIEQGAPFELYFSADEQFVEQLSNQQLTRDSGSLYAVGRVVLLVPKGSSIRPDVSLAGVRDLLRSQRDFKFSIANPEHAPYGRAARQVLERLDLWQPLQPHLVLGENVSQAAQFVTSGNAAAGLVAYSLVLGPRMKERGDFVLLPDELHLPLRQRMVLLKNAGATAEAFYRFVQSSSARRILGDFGFVLPKE